MTDFLELTISILEAGGIYGLMALAYLLVLRPTGIINFAVGEWATLASFFAVATLTWWRLPYLPGALLALAAVAAVGAVSERLVIRPMVERGAPLLTPILILLGMVVVYRESAALAFGTQNLRVPPPFGFGRIELFGIGAPTQSFVVILVSGAVFLGTWLFFERTIWGKAFQAVAIDRVAAGLMGINLRLVAALSFAGAAATAGLAGVLQAPLTSAHYLMGLPLAIKGFSALVVGGVGRVEGCLLGGLVLAAAERLVMRYAPIPSGFAIGVPLLLMIVFLLLRPTGLIGGRRGS
jgi:branched-chain amino acid transport system permease protein